MPHHRRLLTLLAALFFIGLVTLRNMAGLETSPAKVVAWSLYLVGAPLALLGLVWRGWTWTAMACVVYGTVGLALDLATVAGLLGGENERSGLLALSTASGLSNLLLILFGGRAFVQALQGPWPPGSRPPSPPSPSSPSVSSSS